MTAARVRMPRGATARHIRALVVIGLVLAPVLVAFSPAAPAHAHAVVVSTTPTNGEEVDARPRAVVVVFDEPVTFSALSDGPAGAAVVIDAAGERLTGGLPELDEARTTLTIPLPTELATGTYIASWRVVSADTHPVGGSIEFGYGMPVSAAGAAGVDALAVSAPAAELTLAVGVAKGVLYLGLILALGLLPASLALGVWAGPGAGADGREQRLVLRASAIGIALAIFASLTQVVVQFLWVGSVSAGPDVLSALPTFGAFVLSGYGVTVGVRVAALVAIALLLRRIDARASPARRARLWTLLALALVVLATVAQNGHGGAGSGWLFVSTILHAAGAITWLGGLILLGWLLLRRRLSAARLRRMPVWSLLATVAVATLAASGLVQAVVAVSYAEALISTTYGLILIAKVVLVAVAVVLGAFGYVWVRRQLRTSAAGVDAGRPAPGQTSALRSRVRVEVALGAVIVVLSGVLSSVTPAIDDYAPTARATTEIGPYAVTVDASPARRGPQSLRVSVRPPEENSAQPERLEVTLRQVEGTVQGLTVDFPYRIPDALQPGEATATVFVSTAVNIPSSGTWVASIVVVVDDLKQYAGSVTYLVQ